MANWWIRVNYSTKPQTFAVVEQVNAPVNSWSIFPFPTQAEAQAEANTLAANAKKGIVKRIPVIGAAQTAVTDVTSFLGKLSDPHTWLRVAEFAIGAILITVGLNAILKQSTGVDVAGSAATAAKHIPVVV